jgi:hypothetical protein
MDGMLLYSMLVPTVEKLELGMGFSMWLMVLATYIYKKKNLLGGYYHQQN